MNILESLLSSGNADSLRRAASAYGLDQSGTRALLQQLVPAISRGLTRNASTAEGRDDLARALANGQHRRYLDEPGALEDARAIEDGNGILGHIFGSKDVSRSVASRAASETGIDTGLIKQFLPVVAAATMGALSKETGAGARLTGGEGGLGKLAELLDSDKDGGYLDDLLSLGKRLI